MPAVRGHVQGKAVVLRGAVLVPVAVAPQVGHPEVGVVADEGDVAPGGDGERKGKVVDELRAVGDGMSEVVVGHVDGRGRRLDVRERGLAGKLGDGVAAGPGRHRAVLVEQQDHLARRDLAAGMGDPVVIVPQPPRERGLERRFVGYALSREVRHGVDELVREVQIAGFLEGPAPLGLGPGRHRLGPGHDAEAEVGTPEQLAVAVEAQDHFPLAAGALRHRLGPRRRLELRQRVVREDHQAVVGHEEVGERAVVLHLADGRLQRRAPDEVEGLVVDGDHDREGGSRGLRARERPIAVHRRVDGLVLHHPVEPPPAGEPREHGRRVDGVRLDGRQRQEERAEPVEGRHEQARADVPHAEEGRHTQPGRQDQDGGHDNREPRIVDVPLRWHVGPMPALRGRRWRARPLRAPCRSRTPGSRPGGG